MGGFCITVAKKLSVFFDEPQRKRSAIGSMRNSASTYQNFRQMFLASAGSSKLLSSSRIIKKHMNDIFNEHSLAFIRKDRNSKGGGVAIMFDTKICELKKTEVKIHERAQQT